MYLANIKLWNFRTFGADSELDISKPNLDLPLTKGLNVLIGENDSGKSAIIDAIKLVLNTHSYDWIKVTEEDFYKDAIRFRIELQFKELTPDEGKHFTEWLCWEKCKEQIHTSLKLVYDVKRNEDGIFPADVKAGADTEGSTVNAEAREYLKTTYLRPLRDAKADLIPRKNSRLAQILQGHEAFRGKEKDHHLMKHFAQLNKTIKKYFEGKNADDTALPGDLLGKALKDEIDRYIQSFCSNSTETEIDVAEGSLKSILEKLELSIKNGINPGLGTLNRLFMASELLHLNKKNWSGLRLGLIEELEAHLHPQAQMQIIEALQAQQNIQLILTTHSPNLASKVHLSHLIVCNGKQAYPLGEDFTMLASPDYLFLEWFLDVTKANLFFAKGLIIVEGWAEELLIPALAKLLKKQNIISKDLTEAGVSIINVGSIALLRYSRIFARKNGQPMSVPVAIITDVDVRPYEMIAKLDSEGKPIKNEKGKTIYECIPIEEKGFLAETKRVFELRKAEYEIQNIKPFIAPTWTLEYCLHKSISFGKAFKDITKRIHPQIDDSNIEREIALKLIKKSYDKTNAAYLLSQFLLEECKKEKPETTFQKEDTSIKYLTDAIIYACSI